MMRAIMIFAAVLLATFAGSAQAMTPVDPLIVAEARKVGDKFIDALRNGDRKTAEGLVSPNALDEISASFVRDHKKLGAVPKLEHRFALPLRDQILEPGEASLSLVYAVQKDKKWTSAELRLYRYKGEKFKIEYASISNKPLMDYHPLGNGPGKFMLWMFGGLALLGVVGVAALIWILRRKPQWVVPEAETEARAAAMSTRDDPS